MNTGRADVLDRYQVPRHRLTVSAYHHLAQAGILSGDDRVELLEGQLVDMSPIGPRHALAVDALVQLLVPVVTGHGWVRVQNPVALDDNTEPHPDITVVRHPWRGYPAAHPGPEDIFLLLEVADTSLAIDSGAKLELYARAGIREFWIIDLTNDVVQVHRGPGAGMYASLSRIDPSGILRIEGLPGISIPAAPLFT
ncbi:MAG: Uma2 family endonuclease [Acetobacteraceae bacterium]|nr:Uma2 family endonuclease [Acetobacteraceae bacterium]